MSADVKAEPYEFLTEQTVVDYVRDHDQLRSRIDVRRVARVREIGDGNLNLVFHVVDKDGRGIILKQALPYVRMVGDGWPMTPERAQREAHSLQTHHALAPNVVCEVLAYDPEQHVLALEDLSDHRVWRDALNHGLRHSGVADALGRYVAGVAVGTSVLGLDRVEVSEQIASTQNPELCVITEDLVFTEPSFDIGRNAVLPENQPDADALASDAVFRGAMAEAKWRFMTRTEALIHGDLHTGSVMVRAQGGGTAADSVKVFDSEFAFYGPVAFDIGALWANYAFAAARADALGDRERAMWAIGLLDETWEAFTEEYRRLSTNWSERRLWDQEFVERRLGEILRESTLFAAAKMSRRIVGAAKVADIETLEPEIRVGAARHVLLAARDLAASWESIAGPQDVARRLSECLGLNVQR
ncbi:S-methyl-5-thioribose kinase [Agrococcus sp. BE272]|uniref:S-methyl-5-thioribose kinase n=1 Tax=Agrococcus sp. BE272 TaxID=2817727 RepID=UPI0028574DBE|nr:S-methyl-5-thioribose kinase [Agrococcus sp. BE272]MDR7233616.1 5-methylthioribose kinase [Agrococcus sp. BE272]